MLINTLSNKYQNLQMLRKSITCRHKMSRHLKCAAYTHSQTTHLEQAKKKKKHGKLFILITRLWKHSFSQALLNHLPKLRWKKIYKHEVWLLRNASSQSVRTTGCIQGRRENKHWRMSFLHTWCFSQPQIPKFARDAAKQIHSRPTCDFTL